MSTRTHYPRRLVNGRIALVPVAGGPATILRADQVDTFPCGWLYEAGYNEDGERIVAECGALAWGDERGWRCAAGHEHVTAEVRFTEGWDYVTQDEHDEMVAARVLPSFRPVIG